MNHSSSSKVFNPVAVALSLGLATVLPVSATILDDFNAPQPSGWADSDPANLPLAVLGQKGGQQANGVLTFNMNAIGQPYFIASTKTSPTFELQEGRTIEFRVDMVSGQGPDSYTVMGFIPSSTGANSLAGYGLALSESDILITKGINKYFIDDTPNPAVKNANVTLVLNLSVKNGNVYITGQVLDKAANNQVLWEKSFVDTPGADILSDGTDDPPAPYITTGNFVVYLYADNGTDPSGYQVVYDNAIYYVTDAAVLDDFNVAQRSGWEDSDPANLPLAVLGQKGGQQANGVFTYNMNAIGQPYFVASTKTSKTFSLDEGTRHEFAVDMVNGQGPDSYAVLAFIPTATGANSLAGYGLALSESDILVTKGINKYFVDDTPNPAVKNNYVTLVLTLTVQNANVTIRGRVLDKENNNQVLWDKTFVDTPGADILSDGTDDPPAPYVGMNGNVALYLYADNGTDPNGYQVVYDNLMASQPPGATNQPPRITDVSPKNGAAFLTAPVTLSFTASDDNPLPDAGISVSINSTLFTSANGLALSGPATNRTVTLASGIDSNTNHVADLIVTDSDNASVTNTIYFDTFTSSDRVIEIEDYNFSSGQYFDNPVRTAEGGGQSPNSYTDQVGAEGVDFHDARTSPSGNDTLYRTQDPVRMQHSLDQPRPQFDPSSLIYDYDVGDIATDEWLNYTKDFAAGSYEVYLREAVVGFPEADSVLEGVTSDPTQPSQTVNLLGSFLGKLTGYTFRNVPLTDGSGLNKVVLRLSGKTTLRLRQITADTSSSARYQNYLIFVPVAETGVQRATILSIQPAPDATVQSVSPTIVVQIQNRDTSVDTNSIVLQVNSQTVSPTVQPTADGATVTWAMTPLPTSGALNSASISFNDSQGTNQTTPWSFTVTYASLNAANARPTPGPDRGMKVRVVQAPDGSNLDSSLERAEQQLAPNSSIPLYMETNTTLSVINLAQDDRSSGYFQAPDYPETIVPGIDVLYGTEDFAVEIKTWLQLDAGIYKFGIYSDDGYKLSSGATPADKEPILAYHNGGTADETVEFVVPAAGIYPFRLLWYERGGNAYCEWYSMDRTTDARTLINDPASPNAVKAYLDAVAAPAVRVQSSPTVNAGYADDASATVDAANHKVTIPLNGPMRFYRLVGAPKITNPTIQAENLILTYE